MLSIQYNQMWRPLFDKIKRQKLEVFLPFSFAETSYYVETELFAHFI